MTTTSDRRQRGILVTGGSGYVGLTLSRRLAGEAASLRVWAPSRQEVDLASDTATWASKPFPIDLVIHAAASRDRSDPGAHRYPEEVRINVDATARLYEWARTNGVRALVHVSTISVLEPSLDLTERIDEDAQLDLPPHPYALTKRWGEELAGALVPDFDAISIVRPGMIYGPNPPERSTIAKMIAAATGTSPEPRSVAAPRGNVFAPVHVDDVADVLARLALEPRSVIVNVAGPDAVFELDMLRDLAAHLGGGGGGGGGSGSGGKQQEPSVTLDKDAEAVAFAPSTGRIDALFPSRIRTSWKEGLARSFQRNE
jgi:nucleoside-diphosphate-sugar epimerase